MKLLIIEEFKKIFKKKSFWILLVLLLIFSGYQSYSSYSDPYSKDNAIETAEGERLTGAAALRYISSEQHKYAGAITKELKDKLEKDFETEANKIKTLTYDDEKMRKIYGDDYEQFVADAESGKISEEEISERFWEHYEKGVYFSYDASEEEGVINVEKHYKENARFNALHAIYFGDFYSYFDSNGVLSVDDLKNTDYIYEAINLDTFINRQDWLLKEYTSDMNYDNYKSIVYYEDIDKKTDQKIIDYYNNAFLNIDGYFDSEIPNAYLFGNMTNEGLLLLAMLFVSIILTDMFSYDKQCKCDQIILSTKNGRRTMRGAKLIVGILLALMIFILQQLVIVGVSMMMVPIYTLDIPILSRIWRIDSMKNVQTYKDLLVSGCLMIPLAAILMASFTMFFSYVSKNKFVAIIVMMIFIFVTLIFNFESVLGVQISQFIPGNFASFRYFHSSMEKGVVVLGGSVMQWRYIVFGFWMIISIILSGIVLFKETTKTSQ